MKKLLLVVIFNIVVETTAAQAKTADRDTAFTSKTENNKNISPWFWGLGTAILILTILSLIQKNWKGRYKP